MKITGGKSYVRFDLENGYALKADGEVLTNRTFVVYKSAMKNWEAPHDGENLSENQIDELIKLGMILENKYGKNKLNY